MLFRSRLIGYYETGYNLKLDTARRDDTTGSDFLFETNPRFTPVSAADEITRAGEIEEMDFTPLLYQHDPHFRAALLPPWTYTRVST